MGKMLLHTCCGPCSIYCVEKLKQMNINFELLWYNPNIHLYKEYEARRDTLIKLYENTDVKVNIIDEYGLIEFCQNVTGKENERCIYCYTKRLERTAKYAKENGFNSICTTLFVSPYQNHELIKKIGEEIAQKYDIKFEYIDFREGFREGQNKARELGIYMQKYCGCVYSEESRYLCHNQAKKVYPEGIEPLNMPRLEIKRLDNKADYIEMMLEADPSKAMISKYLNDALVYGLKLNDEIICLATILYIDKKTVELKCLVTKQEYRNKGYAKKLLKSLSGNLKQKYDKFIVGTTENNIPFYVKQGFDKYEKTIKNFFIDNYVEEIKEGNLVCTDLIYYSKDLKK